MELMNDNFNNKNNRPDGIMQEDIEYIANHSHLNFKEMENSNILITGATGYIGSFLIKTLLCINRIYKLNLKIFALVRSKEKAEIVLGDCLGKCELELIYDDVTTINKSDYKLDYIIHCASITSSKTMIEKPVETIITSVDGTRRLLEIARVNRPKSFVYISSMEIYGSFETDDDIKEDAYGYFNVLDVRSDYPESKRMCENMCIAYLKEYGVPIKIARLAQCMGSGLVPGENRVFAQFARSVIEGKDIVLHTNGMSEGNYCYIRDAINGILTIMLLGQDGEAYNVANPSMHTTIATMAKMVCEQISKDRIKIVYDIPESNKHGYASQKKLRLNSDKLKNLGWNPEIDMKEAYIRMIGSMTSKER